MCKLMFLFLSVAVISITVCVGSVFFCSTCAYASETDFSEAVEVLETHLDAIHASDYLNAEACFSESFRAAILPRVTFVNSYLLSTHALMGEEGYIVLETIELEKPEHLRIAVSISGRIVFYYLINERTLWKIELFSDESFDNLSDARRELFLFTDRDWNDDESKELKCIASLYRIQQQLEQYKGEKGEGFYPDQLRGGTDRDALTIWEYFTEETGYPTNHFVNRPMENVAFDKPTNGEFTYFGVDSDDDDEYEAYYLIAWGKTDSANSLFRDSSIIALLASDDDRSAAQIETDFIFYIKMRYKIDLVPVSEPLDTPET